MKLGNKVAVIIGTASSIGYGMGQRRCKVVVGISFSNKSFINM